MENFSLLMDGFAHILSFNHVLLMMLGVTLGILVGVLPGLGAPNGVSLLFAADIHDGPDLRDYSALVHVLGALFGGSTTSILFNIPGNLRP